jgi:hypothetical protein
VNGDTGAEPGTAELDALARLGHAGYAVALILARPSAADGNDSAPDPSALQRLAHDAGGQIAAFFHRVPGDQGLAAALDEVARRWRADLGQVPCIAGNVPDLITVATSGGQPVALTTHLATAASLPSGCFHHPDLMTFVDALLNEPVPMA